MTIVAENSCLRQLPIIGDMIEAKETKSLMATTAEPELANVKRRHFEAVDRATSRASLMALFVQPVGTLPSGLSLVGLLR